MAENADLAQFQDRRPNQCIAGNALLALVRPKVEHVTALIPLKVHAA